jgi:hypothetical protein
MNRQALKRAIITEIGIIGIGISIYWAVQNGMGFLIGRIGIVVGIVSALLFTGIILYGIFESGESEGYQ